MARTNHNERSANPSGSFVENWVFNNRARLLLIFAGLAGAVALAVGTGCLAGQYDGEPCGADKRVFYLLSAFVYLGVIMLWLLRVRTFREDLHSHADLVDSDGYRELHAKYEQFLAILPSKRYGRYANVCKVVYIALWLAYTLYVASAFSLMGLDGRSKLVLMALAVIGTLLNGVSYYKCVVYVWFLKEVSNRRLLRDEDFLTTDPRLTPKYRRLEVVANDNASTFLVVTLLFAISLLLDVQLLNVGLKANFPALLCFAMVSVVGVVTYVAMVVYSRKYLRRIVDDWGDLAAGEVIDSGRFGLIMPGGGGGDARFHAEDVRAFADGLSAQRGRSATAVHGALSLAIAAVDLAAVLLSLK